MAGRKKRRKNAPDSNKSIGKIRPVVYGTLAALVFTMVAILLFAFIIKTAGLSDEVIPPVNQVIKMAAIAIAAFVAVSRAKSAYLLCGSLSGVAYVLLGFLVFSLIQGTFSPGVELLSDLLMGFIAAAIISLLVGKLRKKPA
ncbi:MAG: TIGR04086 family membrane protein [Christensenellales bacterium]